MKGYIIDSTYKENIITDNNQFLSIKSSSDISPNNSVNTYNLPLNINNSPYIKHNNKNDNLNPYNIIDYL